MSIFVIDGSFVLADPDIFDFRSLDEAADGASIDLPNTVEPRDVFERVKAAPAVRIDFPSPADGRGFSIASALRQMGYRGHLRASGHLLAEQYPMALRCGFDSVEIDVALAKRQPEELWHAAMLRTANTYQARIGQKRAA